MGQHELDSLAIICMERAYGNQAIVNSIDNKTDIFGQLFLLIRLRDNIESVDRIKYANFQLSYFSNHSSFIRWKMVNVYVYIPISTPTLSGVA